MIVLTISVIVIIAIIFWYLLSLTLWTIRSSRMVNNIPGPKPLPIIGNALMFANVKNLDDGAEILLKLLKEYCHKQDKIMKFWLGTKLIVVLGNPQHIETVLSSEHAMSKETLYAYAREFLSDGVVAENYKKWSELRKMVNPFLTRKAIEPNLEMFHEKVVRLIKVIDNKVENDKEFNIKHFIAKCAIDMMNASNFGSDTNETENDGDRTVTLETALESAVDGIFRLIVSFPSCLSVKYSKITSVGRNTIKNSRFYWNLLAKILRDRKNNFKVKNEEKSTIYADAIIQKAERDNLSWVQTGKMSSDYLMAGSHSVSLMSSNAILLLAMHPEYQDAAYQEQIRIMGNDPDIAPTWEQLSNMTYLTRVFKEVIRHLTAPFISRDTENDIDLGKYKIPKGSSVFIVFYAMHRDPNIWSHPEEFYPDHFLPEESAKRPKNSYLPFSWGPRNCPGAIYAMTAVKIILSALIRKYSFKTDLKYEELTYKYSVFADFSQGQLVKKIPRTV